MFFKKLVFGLVFCSQVYYNMRTMNNSLYEQVRRLLGGNSPIAAFVDMDGVLTEYKYGEGNSILNGETNVFLEKRPIQAVVDFVSKYYDVNNNEFKILTSCITKNQELAKLKWIESNMNFFNPNDYMCVLSKDFNSRVDKKVSIICDYVKAHPEKKKTLVIEDTHEVLKKCWDNNPEKILPVHVINIIK